MMRLVRDLIIKIPCCCAHCCPSCCLYSSLPLPPSTILYFLYCVFFILFFFYFVFTFLFPVPPIIEPFSFQEGLSEGMRTRTVCGVSKGDAPLFISWFKDGEPLPSILGANVTSLDQYSSLLSIPSLSSIHTGDYSCVASNPAAEFKYTATLQVKGIVFEV